MKKRTTMIIYGLVATNLITAVYYGNEVKTLHNKLDNEIETVQEINSRYIDLFQESNRVKLQVKEQNEDIASLNQTIKDKNKLINKMKKDLEKAKKRNESPSVHKQVSRGSNKSQSKNFVVTAYTAGYESTQKSPGQVGYGITASGKYVKQGRTIACPRSMKMGTKVKIQNVGYRICEDRGSDIVSGRLDVYFENLHAAQRFGKQTLPVQILN